MNAIGVVQNEVTQQTDLDWGKIVSGIHVREELGDGLRGLDAFSHVIVVTYLNEASFSIEKHLVRRRSLYKPDFSCIMIPYR